MALAAVVGRRAALETRKLTQADSHSNTTQSMATTMNNHRSNTPQSQLGAFTGSVREPSIGREPSNIRGPGSPTFAMGAGAGTASGSFPLAQSNMLSPTHASGATYISSRFNAFPAEQGGSGAFSVAGKRKVSMVGDPNCNDENRNLQPYPSGHFGVSDGRQKGSQEEGDGSGGGQPPRPGEGGVPTSTFLVTLTTKQLIFFLFDGFPAPRYTIRYPRWGHASDILGNINFLFVVLSCVSFATETLPEFYDRDLLAFSVIEFVCVVYFTIELAVRAIFCDSRSTFAKSPQNWIDLISIIPFYVNLITGGEGGAGASGLIMVRTLRLLRILRVLKLSKNNVGLEAVVEALKQSSEAISLLAFLLVIAVVLFSSAMFFAEQLDSTYDTRRQLWIRPDLSVSPFQSIFHTMWWCIVTMTTVGYGDAVPISALGKVVAGVTMIAGLFVLAFPTVILSTNFQEIHQAKVDAQRQLADEYELQLKEAQNIFAAEREAQEHAVRRNALLGEGVGNVMDVASRPVGVDGGGDADSVGGAACMPAMVVVINGEPSEDADAAARIAPATPSNAATVLPTSFSYKCPQVVAAGAGGTADREIVVINDEIAVYDPCIFFQCTDDNHLHVRIETFGVKTVVTMQLVLDSEEVQRVAEEVTRKHRPDRSFPVVSRPVTRLTVDMHTEHPLLGELRLMTSVFDEPAGAVPVSILVPFPQLANVLLANLSSLEFSLSVSFDCPAVIEEPLIHYGGMVLGTTNYDDDEEDVHQLAFITQTTVSSPVGFGPTSFGRCQSWRQPPSGDPAFPAAEPALGAEEGGRPLRRVGT